MIEHNRNLATRISSISQDSAPWQPPLRLDLTDRFDASYAEQLFEDNRVSVVTDRVNSLARDLYSMRSFGSDLGIEQDQYVEEIKNQGLGYGIWFYFPWDRSLVRYLEQKDHRDLRTFRNRELINSNEQAALYAARIAIFGLSVGSGVVESLAMSGIGGTLIMGDFDVLELSNTNRVRSDIGDVGSKKIDIIAKKVSKIDPYIDQVHLQNGFNSGDFESDIKYDLMFDEVDDLKAKYEMRDLSRRRGKPLIMVTDAGDRAIIDIERYDTQSRTKPFLGKISERAIMSALDDSISNSDRQKMLAKFVGIKNISGRLIKSAMLIGDELGGIPQLYTTAGVCGSLGAFAAREIILGRDIKSGRYISNFRKLFDTGSPDGAISDVTAFFKFLKK